jgi:hypothetical protein
MFRYFALQTLDQIFINFAPNDFRWIVPASMDSALRFLRFQPVEKGNEHVEVKTRRPGAAAPPSFASEDRKRKMQLVPAGEHQDTQLPNVAPRNDSTAQSHSALPSVCLRPSEPNPTDPVSLDETDEKTKAQKATGFKRRDMNWWCVLISSSLSSFLA